MNLKVFDGKLSGEPQLAYLYRCAIGAVYDIPIHLDKKVFSRFSIKEAELRKLNIELYDYAYGVCIILESWVKGKGLTFVPVNAFLGEWALKKYMKINNSMTIRIDDIDTAENVELLYVELLVARYYIEANLIKYTRLYEIVEELKPLLSSRWLEMYKQHERSQLVTKTLLQLEYEYMVDSPNTYNDIVDTLVLRGHS